MTPARDIPPRLPNPAESLMAQFRDWEKRGRGWQVWNESAFLEPPYRPFMHISIPQALVDDGRRPTLVSSLLESVRGLWSQKRREPPLEPFLVTLFQEPDIPPYEDDEDLVELQVVLPATAKVTNETFATFLLALGFCASPLAFEVIGSASEIVVQIVARESDSGEVADQLRAHFPEAVVRAAPEYLFKLWVDGKGSHAVALEFGLSEEFMRPLQTLSTGADPLVAITGALASLREGEIGVLQILFESVRHPWAESIFRAVTGDDGEAFFEDAPELVGLARQKIQSPLYAAVIRVAARSGDEDRAWQIARNLGGGLAALDHPGVNRLMPLDNEGYEDIQHQVDLILRHTRRSGMILNSDELVSLVHLPTPLVRSKKLKRQAGRTRRVPAAATGHETVLGLNEHEGVTVPVTLSTDQRVRHMHVIGAPGTGKSTLLEQMILQDMDRGHGVAVLDPHGDLIEHVLERVKEERRGDVILFDPSDEAFPVGFNILSAHSEIEKNLLSSDLVGVFRRLSTAWGDQMTSVLANAILAFLESEGGGTLADLRRFLIERSFRDEFLKSVKDPQVVYYWRKEFPLLTGGKSLGPLLTRLDTFLRFKLVRHVVAQRENKLDFRRIMDEGKIFLAKLSQGAIGEENAWLLGSLLVSKFHQIALARQDVKESERKPFFMFIDEFHNFVTPSMTQILSGARKYGLGLVLAHHELRQLGGAGSDIGSAVIANPHTRVCFRLGDEDARKMEGGFSGFEARDFQNLGTGEAIARVERAEFDFNLATLPMPVMDKDEARTGAAVIVKLSREKYATPRAEVEADLARNSASEDGGAEGPPKKNKREGSKKEEQPSEERPKPGPPPGVDEPATPGAVKSATEAGNETATTQVDPDPPPPSYDAALRERTAQEPGASLAVAKPPVPGAPGEPPPLGRGSAKHKAMQKQFALWARGMGWRAEIEWKLPGTPQAVDLHLEKGGVTVACEFPVTSTVKDEVKNIRKCLAAGYQHVVLIADAPSRLSKIEEAAADGIADPELARVRFASPESFIFFMGELEKTLPPTAPGTALGLTTRRVHRPRKEPPAHPRQSDIHGLLEKSFSKNSNKSKKDGGS